MHMTITPSSAPHLALSLELDLSRSPLLPSISQHIPLNPESIVLSPPFGSEISRYTIHDVDAFLEKHGYSTPLLLSRRPSLGSTTTSTSTFTPRPTSRAIIKLLSLLDSVEDDVVREVQRVKESIREAHGQIDDYRQAKTERIAVKLAERRREKRETKGMDFWLGV